MSSPYKQALLGYPNNNELEAQKGANEAMDEDVYEGLSNNSKTVKQPLHNAHHSLIYFGKFTSQVPSYGSSVEDNEEIDSSSRPFDGHLEMDIEK